MATQTSLKFFSFFPQTPKFDFLKHSKIWFSISIFAVLASFMLLGTRGLNYGVDFKGGTQVHLKFNQSHSSNQIREVLSSVALSQAMVQEVGEGQKEFLLRLMPENLDLEKYKNETIQKLSNIASDPKIRFAEGRAYVSFKQSVLESQIKDALKNFSNPNLSVESVSAFGNLDDNEFLVIFSSELGRIRAAFEKQFGKDSFEVLQVEQVGSKVGKELRAQAMGAVLVSVLLILIYVWFRFDLEFAPGGAIALLHDALLVLGVFSLLGLEFDLSIVAAVLTIVGFSINDTIVLYDRVRENLRLLKNVEFEDVINRSINETLSRTILTSGTLFIAILALYFFGGPITKNFAFAFIVGILAGTYSTIFVASPVTIYFHRYLLKKKMK